MAWFRLDDGTLNNRKLRRLLRRERTVRPFEALGVWVACGLQAAHDRSDGAIDPDWLEDTFDDAGLSATEGKALVDALLERGLLDRLQDGSLAVHDFLDYNPSSGALTAEKARKELSRDKTLTAAIRERDGNRCYFCDVSVDFKDRRSEVSGTYWFLTAIENGGQVTAANTVVACRGCVREREDGTRDIPPIGSPNNPGPNQAADLAAIHPAGPENQSGVSASRPVPDPIPTRTRSLLSGPTAQPTPRERVTEDLEPARAAG